MVCCRARTGNLAMGSESGIRDLGVRGFVGRVCGGRRICEINKLVDVIGYM